MGIQKEHHQQLAEFTAEYDLQPIASHLSGIIKECLAGGHHLSAVKEQF